MAPDTYPMSRPMTSRRLSFGCSLTGRDGGQTDVYDEGMISRLTRWAN